MRRWFALLAALMLVASLAGTSVAAVPARSGFIGEFDLVGQGDGFVFGHVSAALTAPTEANLVPGHHDFFGSEPQFEEAHALLTYAEFWYDPDAQGGSNVAYTAGIECVYVGPNDTFCRSFTGQFVDVLDVTATDYVVYHTEDGGVGPACEDHPCDPGWSEYIFNAGKGAFVVRVGQQQ